MFRVLVIIGTCRQDVEELGFFSHSGFQNIFYSIDYFLMRYISIIFLSVYKFLRLLVDDEAMNK